MQLGEMLDLFDQGLIVLKLFYPKYPFDCCTKWVSMQSAFGMVAAESKLLTQYKTIRKVD